MTAIAQTIQDAIAIIQQGRELERMLIDAGFVFAESKPATATRTDAAAQTHPTDPTPTVEDASEAPEWPQANANGELIDARGIAWDERIHASTKACTADGSWRMRRGADPEIVKRLEAEAMAALQEEPAAEPEVDEFSRIKAGMERAADQAEIDEWWDYARQVVISQSQRYALEACAEERIKQLSAVALTG